MLENSEKKVPFNNEDNTEEIKGVKYEALQKILLGYEEYWLDQKGIIISSNLEAVTITGYDEWEIMGKHISILYTEVDIIAGKLNNDLFKADEKGQVTMSGMKLKKRGQHFWATIKITAIKPFNDSSPKYIFTIQDTTHKAMYKLAILQVRDEYLNLFNNSFIAILKFNYQTGSITKLNKKCEAYFDNNSRDELDKRSFRSIFFDSADYVAIMALLQQHSKVENFEFRSNSESERWLSISCKLYAIKQFVEGVVIDITERRREILKLKEVNEELDRFIYHASHDLRSPITSVEGLLSLIKMESNNGQLIKTYCVMAQQRLTHLTNLLRDFVALAYNNTVDAEHELIDMQSVILEVLAELEQYKHVKVLSEVENKIPFRSSRIRIRLILKSLLDNALKYQDPSSQNPTVKIIGTVTKYNLKLSVSDNGIGIEKEHRKKVFDVFFRGTTLSNGSGMGLYIVKSIINKLSGDIELKSEINKGTTVIVNVPNKLNHLVPSERSISQNLSIANF